MAYHDAPDVFNKPNIWLTIDGEAKTGKTHLALTLAVGQTSVLDLNEGLNGVVHKRVQELAKSVGLANAKRLIKIASHPPVDGPTKEAIKSAAITRFAAVRTDLTEGLSKSRTTILDAGTDLHRLARQSEFGDVKSASKKGALDYEMVNSRMRGLTRLFHSYKSHFVMVHQLEDEWVQYRDPDAPSGFKSRKTGKLVRDGWKNVGFDVEIGIRTGKKVTDEHGLIFTAEIEICRFDPHVEGTIIEEPSGLLNLPYIISYCTGTEVEQWLK